MLGLVQMASGMFVHEASILVVIANALRLLHQSRAQKVAQLDEHQVTTKPSSVN
jgi:Cd2+/Zn2+-exporting ATPase